MYNNTVDSYSINQKEYCYNLEDMGINPNSMKAYIPVLMPRIQRSTPKEQTKSLTTLSICNAPECYPHIDKKVHVQNYITLNRYPGETTAIEHKSADSHTIPAGSKFIVDILHGDILTMYFTGIM